MSQCVRKPYPTDVPDEEWTFVAPYLTLLREDCRQRRHDLREVFNAVRWVVRAGAPWRLMPNHFPPWAAVHQQLARPAAVGLGPRP
jgi:transposase